MEAGYLGVSNHLVETTIQLAQCPRCNSFVFLAQSGGMRSAADPAPVDRQGYVDTLLGGLRTFELFEVAGRPHKLLTRSLGSSAPMFTPEGLQRAAQGRRKVLREHGCGAQALSMARVVSTEPDTTPVCDTWQAQGWAPPPGKCGRARDKSIKSCPTCEPPPFVSPLLASNLNQETGASQEGRDDQIREKGGPHGPGPHGSGGHRSSGRSEAVDRQPWLRPDVGADARMGRGDLAASLDPGPEVGQPPHRRSHQPTDSRQPAQQPAGGHTGGVQSQPGPLDQIPLGHRNPSAEVGAVPRDGQAFTPGVPARNLGLSGGSGGGSRGISGGPYQHGASQGNSTQCAPQSPEWHLGQVPGVQSDPYPKCGTCNKYIKSGEMYWGIQHGTRWIYCEHEECE